MLKEILKIDGSDTGDHTNEKTRLGNEGAVSSNRRDECGPSSQPKQNKKLMSYVNRPHSAGEYHSAQPLDSVCWPAPSHAPPMSTPVTELSRICSLVGMPQPDFSFLRTPQGSLGVNFPLPPPIFPNYPPTIPPGTIPPVFPQPTAKIMPPSSHLFGSMPWGPSVPVPGKPFHHTSYSGTVPVAGGMAAGVHNQFIPLQVTKKRVANKKNLENKEALSSRATPLQTSQPGSSDVTKGTPQECSSASLKSSQMTQPVSSQGEAASQAHSTPHQKSTPSSSSRRKSRKLAVNFGISKPSE